MKALRPTELIPYVASGGHDVTRAPGAAAPRVRPLGLVAAVAATVALTSGVAAFTAARQPLTQSTSFYTPPTPAGAQAQIDDLREQGNGSAAAAVTAMVGTPRAIWLTASRGYDVTDKVAGAVAQAGRRGELPTFVLYGLPHRTCGTKVAASGGDSQYREWAGRFAAALSGTPAVVIVEPDALAQLPSDCPVASVPGGDEAARQQTDARFADIAYAVDRTLHLDPHALVYLDAGHPGWRSAAEMARRLQLAGVGRVRGFALNVANYQRASEVERYGLAISRCLAYARSLGTVHGCDRGDSRVSSAGPGRVLPTTPFIIDTSRSGTGPWMPASAKLPDPQPWCNAPGAGAGPRPVAVPGGAEGLVDAYLWVKTPGESDGPCTRGVTNAAWDGLPVDPLWAARIHRQGFVDPPAGTWFPQQALELAQHANPPLR